MNELAWFYFVVVINLIIGFATYYASKRDRRRWECAVDFRGYENQ